MDKKVAMLALEADHGEMERRAKYRILANLFFRDTNRPAGMFLNYQDWTLGRYRQNEYISNLYPTVLEIFNSKFKNILTFYRKRDFGVAELTKQLLYAKENANLIILDHLHYIDLKEDNENSALTDVVKTIRDITIEHKVPVILVAHIRKTGYGAKKPALIPSIEDFHGSSNISKIATRAIMIGPCYDDVPVTRGFATYMHIAKNRRDGSRTRFMGKTIFSNELNAYEPSYSMGKISHDRSEYNTLEAHELPYWANTNA